MAGISPQEFISSWGSVELTKRASSQPHFIDPCRLLGQPTPTEADGLVSELEPVEEAPHAPAEAAEVVEVPVDVGDASAIQGHPQAGSAGRPSDLAGALASWLEKHPNDYPDLHPPGDFAARLSWLSGTLWAYDFVKGARPDPMAVARALGELGRPGREEAA